MADMHTHQVIMERLAQLPSIKIPKIEITPKGQSISQAFEFSGQQIAEMLCIKEHQLAQEVCLVSVEIATWGRHTAVCRRAWQMTERNYRVWRDGIVKHASQDPGERDPKWKRPTEKQLEAIYRTMPLYVHHQTAIEHSEEMYNASIAVLEGFRAKKDMLRTCVIRSVEDSSPRLSIS